MGYQLDLFEAAVKINVHVPHTFSALDMRDDYLPSLARHGGHMDAPDALPHGGTQVLRSEWWSADEVIVSGFGCRR